MKHNNKELVATYAKKILRTEEWMLFPSYLDQRIAKIRTGRLSLKIELATTILKGS